MREVVKSLHSGVRLGELIEKEGAQMRLEGDCFQEPVLKGAGVRLPELQQQAGRRRPLWPRASLSWVVASKKWWKVESLQKCAHFPFCFSYTSIGIVVT